MQARKWRAKCRGEKFFNDRELGNFKALTPCRHDLYPTLESLSKRVCGKAKPIHGSYAEAFFA
jgi:hypothetical protein